MVVTLEQAEVVKSIFINVLLGKGTQAITDTLIAKGIPSRKNNK